VADLSAWDNASALLDDKVDEGVGDTIEYAANGVNFVNMQGFVIPDVADPGPAEFIDETVATRWKIKIAKRKLPYPEITHRLRHPKLGAGNFRPIGAVPDPQTQGRYWLFDVEKA
jgi:hypothetical protein